MLRLNLKNNREALTLIVVFVIVLLASAAAVYLIAGRVSAPTPVRNDVQSTVEQAGEPRTSESPTLPQGQLPGFFEGAFSTGNQRNVLGGSWGEILAKITLRLSLAALLGAALAFRPRRQVHALKRNPYVAQTQILLAVVASALMIIVGDNAARAFGIFAAVSLVRFRTNIRDPKEITVLLISLALGLASGVGHWDLALILTLFSFILLWVLEIREPETVSRSMQVKISTRDVKATQEILRDVFHKHGFVTELRTLARENEAPGSIVYAVDISPIISTDELSAEILSHNGTSVDSIEWDQKKSFSYLYQ